MTIDICSGRQTEISRTIGRESRAGTCENFGKWYCGLSTRIQSYSNIDFIPSPASRRGDPLLLLLPLSSPFVPMKYIAHTLPHEPRQQPWPLKSAPLSRSSCPERPNVFRKLVMPAKEICSSWDDVGLPNRRHSLIFQSRRSFSISSTTP